MSNVPVAYLSSILLLRYYLYLVSLVSMKKKKKKKEYSKDES